MRRHLPLAVLGGITLIWGCTFLVGKFALGEYGPLGFVAARFGLAAIALLLVSFRRMRGLTRAELLAGIGIGASLFLAYGLQASGLVHTTSSKSGFITALYVPLVPVFQWWIMRKAPGRMAYVGAAVSFCGLALLSVNSLTDLTLGKGELLTLGGAVASAVQIVLIGRFAPKADSLRLAAVQVTVVTLLALICMPIAGETFPLPSTGVLAAVLGMGIIGTGLVIVVMNWAQRTVSPSRATLIYALEPVWAGVAGALAGEPFNAQTIAGSTLILSGIVVGEIRTGEQKQVAPEPAIQLAG